MDSGEYYTKMWTARSNKSDIRANLPLKAELELAIGEDLFVTLCLEHVIEVLLVEDGLYREEHCLLFPVGLELVNLLTEEVEPPQIIDSESIKPFTKKAKARFFEKAHNAVAERIQVPLLESGALGAKFVVFSFFLLLTGAVSYETALILKEDENQEIQYQDDLVKYLNDLSEMLFKDSYLTKGKQFVVGDLSNFIRRKKHLTAHFGDVVKREDIFFFFDLVEPNGTLRPDEILMVVDKLMNGLDTHLQDGDGDLNVIVAETIQTFIVASPLKQTHKKALFVGEMDFNYYYRLQDAVEQYFDPK